VADGGDRWWTPAAMVPRSRARRLCTCFHGASRPRLAFMDELSLDRVREVVCRVLEPEARVVAAYAYGSRVDGRPLPLSDLDLALVLSGEPPQEDPLFAERLAARIATTLGTGIEVDAHLAECLPLGVRGRVVTSGVLLYERDPVRRVEFETSTRRLYFDFLPILERDAREGLAAGG